MDDYDHLQRWEPPRADFREPRLGDLGPIAGSILAGVLAGLAVLGIAWLFGLVARPAHAAVPTTSPAWVDITQAPYNADPTDTTNSTAGIRAAISAALTGGHPLYLPQGKYKISGELVIDTTGTGGIKIISDNAALDAAAIPSGPALMLQRSGGTPGSPAVDSGSQITGSLAITEAQASGYSVVVGKADFSDRWNGFRADRLAVTNSSTAGGSGGVQLNYLMVAELNISASISGGSASVGALALEQVQNSRLSGFANAAGATAPSVLIENGTSTGNTIAGENFGSSNTCLSVTVSGASAALLVPQFNCTTAVNAPTSGPGLQLISPLYGGTNAGPISSGWRRSAAAPGNRASAPAARDLYGRRRR